MRDAKDEESGSDSDRPSKKPQGKKSVTSQKGPGDVEARKLGQAALAVLNDGKKVDLPKGFSLWTRGERFAYTRAGGFCETCAFEEGRVMKGMKVDHAEHKKKKK